jgi:cytochrome c-type biogenesis protein
VELGNVTVLLAFVAGMVAFFSPCQLPLLPLYLGFLSGSVADEGGRPVRNRALFNSINFVTGFSLVFMLLGLLASWFAAFFAAWGLALQRLAGIVIIFFGLYLAGAFRSVLLGKERRIRYLPESAGPGSSLLMGMAFAAGWTPCIGPVLGSILLLTAATGDGPVLLAAFALGLALPYLLAAVLVEQTGRWVERFAVWLPHLQRIFGVFMVAVGVAVFFGLLSRLAALAY